MNACDYSIKHFVFHFSLEIYFLESFQGIHRTQTRLLKLVSDLVHHLFVLPNIVHAHQNCGLQQFVEVPSCASRCAENFSNQCDFLDCYLLCHQDALLHQLLNFTRKAFRQVASLVVRIKQVAQLIRGKLS